MARLNSVMVSFRAPRNVFELLEARRGNKSRSAFLIGMLKQLDDREVGTKQWYRGTEIIEKN